MLMVPFAVLLKQSFDYLVRFRVLISVVLSLGLKMHLCSVFAPKEGQGSVFNSPTLGGFAFFCASWQNYCISISC